jgi:DNA-directed RNA polymerase specialized sigma24 family protein
MVRLNLQTMKSNRNPTEMISMLDSAGCGRSEIAELLGTTTNAVNVALFRAKRKAARK